MACPGGTFKLLVSDAESRIDLVALHLWAGPAG
jgi:hypothetical protein